MTVAEILAQIRALSPAEQAELYERWTAKQAESASEDESHWGKSLMKLVREIGPIEMIHPEIEDPVEWVKTIRREQDERRGLDWGADDETPMLGGLARKPYD